MFFFFFFNEPATTELYTYLHTLSLHDALPILPVTPITEAMLTMRPRRAFIIPRITALQLRKTLVRLVSRIACQSSSFIRISRLSRVMPALLTRIEIGRAHV